VGDEEDVMEADQEERGSSTEDQRDGGRHSAPEGADRHPLIDLNRDPNPGVADHAKSEED
jgi:hypothetical protein